MTNLQLARDIFLIVFHNRTVTPSTDRYAQMRATCRVHERALFLPLRTPNELELQARWLAGEFGKNFVSETGDKIDIVQFGTWNREAGPDFCDAAVRVNGSEPLRGCIEIDLVDRNWDLHGHAINPAFEETVLHVFVDKSDRQFFTRTKSNRNVPQVRIDPAILPEAFSANIPLARPGRCQAPLGNLPEDRVRSVLDAAGQFRLQKKAARIRAKIDNHGRDEALFQEIAAALGYKENKLPLTLIAQRLSLKALRKDLKDAEAIFQVLAQSLQREPLRNQRKRQLVLFITEGGRDFLKERFVSPVIVDLGADAGGFFLQTKLAGGIEHAPDAIFRQVSERRLATPRPSERNVGAERLRQNRRIDPHLGDVAIRFGAREKFAVTFIDKNVKDRFFERGIDGVTM